MRAERCHNLVDDGAPGFPMYYRCGLRFGHRTRCRPRSEEVAHDHAMTAAIIRKYPDLLTPWLAPASTGDTQ